MRELIDEFNEDEVYIFRKSYTTFTSPLYDLIDGMKVKVINKELGNIRHKGISYRITPEMCEKVI